MIFFLIGILSFQIQASDFRRPSKLGYTVWSGCLECENPESTLYDPQTKKIYVSNVSGAPKEKDKKGWINILDIKGNLTKEKWVDGLNAPKGMGILGKKLYVTDIDQIVVIDIKDAKVLKKIPVENATFLNDIAVDDVNKVIYVSDTETGKIHQVVNDEVSLFLDKFEDQAPNGLLVVNESLFVATWGTKLDKNWNIEKDGSLFQIDLKSKKVSPFYNKTLGQLDGLALDTKGNFIVSDWVKGKVYLIDKRGVAKEIYQSDKGTADIAFVASDGLLLIPHMNKGIVTAFQFAKY